MDTVLDEFSKSRVDRSLMDNTATIGFFQVHYQFPKFFKVLCDLYFLKHLAVNKINPVEALTGILKGKVKLFTTQCILQELTRESKYQFDEKVLTILECKHKMQDHEACVENVIGNKNDQKFYFATVTDHDLHLKMQKKPAVPVIVGMGERIVLKKYSSRQAQLAAAFKDKIPVEEGSPLEEMNEVILFYKTYYGIKFPPQVLIDGPSLRYLASNGISLADVAKVVGTTRNSVCTTSCVFGEIKKAGEDMEGALGLATGLKFAYCGHQGFEAGHVCYESVLREGQHIGTSLESGLLENSPMMEGVPFIIARDKQLIMKPPSETLINSKEMPHSEKTQLLALAKSQNEKDHQAGKKRSAKKDEVGSFSKKMKYAKK